MPSAFQPESSNLLSDATRTKVKGLVQSIVTLESTPQSNAVWTAAGFGISTLIRVGSNLILTRLLAPEAFGLMSLVMAFVIGVAFFTDVGIGQALIQNPRGEDPVFRNTVWTIQIIRGFGMFVICLIIAAPVAALYNEPELFGLLATVSLSVLLSGFTSSGLLIASRQLRIARVTLCQLASVLLGTGLMVLLVWQYRSVWAMAWSNVFAALITLILGYIFFPGVTHSLRLDRASAAELATFGRWVFISTIFTFFSSQSDRLLIGKLLGTETLGVLGIGLMLATLPMGLLNQLDRGILFPMYCRVFRERPNDLSRAVGRGRLPLLFVGCAMTAGLIAAGPDLVRGLYDQRYLDAGWMVQVAALAGLFQLFEKTRRTALVSCGRSKDEAISNGVKVVGLFAFIPIGYHFGGLVGLMIGFVAADVLMLGCTTLLCRRQGLHGVRQDAGFAALTILLAALGLVADRAFGDLGTNAPALLQAVVVGLIAAVPLAIGGALHWSKLRPGSSNTQAGFSN